MDLKKLHELAKLADLCRKKGIESIKVGENGYEFRLSPEAPKSNYKKKQSLAASEPEAPTLTEEDMLYWSAGQAN